MKRPIKLIPFMLILLLLAQTNSDYTSQMVWLLGKIFSSLLMIVFPVLINYGIFKAVFDVFKGKRMYKPRALLMLLPALLAQTTTTYPIDEAKQLFDVIAGYLGIFFAFLLPGFFILLLVKALTKLIKM